MGQLGELIQICSMALSRRHADSSGRFLMFSGEPVTLSAGVLRSHHLKVLHKHQGEEQR